MTYNFYLIYIEILDFKHVKIFRFLFFFGPTIKVNGQLGQSKVQLGRSIGLVKGPTGSVKGPIGLVKQIGQRCDPTHHLIQLKWTQVQQSK